MVFLDNLREYLERRDAPKPAFEPVSAVHRKHVVERLAELEKAGLSEEELRRKYEIWTPKQIDLYVGAMGNALLEDFAHDSSPERLAQWINLALDRELGIGVSTGSNVQDWQLDRLGQQVWSILGSAFPEEKEYVAPYALRIRAVRLAADRQIVTPIGKLVLELPDKDAIRWLLAAEQVQSHGAEDEWRLCRESASFLLQNPVVTWEQVVGASKWPIEWKLLWRLSLMGIVEETSYHDGRVDAYALLSTARPLLEEVASGKDTPFTLLVQAFLQDETASVLHRVRPAGMIAQAESSVEVTARHARMVAHEIRNALVPVQSAVESLYRDLDRQGATDVADKRRGTIEGGIERVFRFLRDISKIADLASAPSDLFDVTSAVQDAIAAFGSSIGISVPFEQTGLLPAVKGHRDRFVLALLNVLRNAAQARLLEGLQIRVSAGTHNGAEVFVAVDDNGPGVPAEHRASIFEAGFSLRPDGTGQGLALVREVIEVEMAGRAICEQSGLGGARMVLRLPVGAKRKV